MGKEWEQFQTTDNQKVDKVYIYMFVCICMCMYEKSRLISPGIFGYRDEKAKLRREQGLIQVTQGKANTT